MSDYDQHDDERRKEPAFEARVQLRKWSPWIWIIPLLATFLAGYLIVRYGFLGGGDITVRFAEARGLDRFNPVRFRGAKVGTVEKITIDEELKQVVVRISIDASMKHALKTGTRFWIVEPSLESGGLSSLLSTAYVGIAPGEGKETREFKGQEYAPILAPPEAGKVFILDATGLGSINMGSPVQFQGIHAGHILGAEYDERRRVTTVHAFVVQRFADHVRQSTRFWRAAGLSGSLTGKGLSMNGPSLLSLLNTPIEIYTPDVLQGRPAVDGTHFDLYESQAEAQAAAGGPQLTYVIYFPGSVRGLTAGTPVQMQGVQVGQVREVRLRYVPQTATLETLVTVEIDPRQLELPVTETTTREELRNTMNDALQKLVQKGMRATLTSSLVLPGANGVSLEMAGKRGTARLAVEHDPPIIPAASADNGIEGALSSINQVAARIRDLPIEEIAEHLRSTTERMDALVNDPALSQSLQHLNRSLADIEKVAVVTRENIGPIAESLRNAATSAEAAAARAQQLMATAPRQNYDLGELIKELTRAAEAVRALASYLTENPDALLKGRGKAK
ncbi:MAG TPA: MlaD family protein [Thermoanaerobaculia bacterium]